MPTVRPREDLSVMPFVVVGGLVLLALAVLTAQGSMVRGLHPGRAMLTGMFFPVTWVVWYARDEHPWARSVLR